MIRPAAHDSSALGVVKRFFGLDFTVAFASASLLIVGLMAIFSAVHLTGPSDVFKKQILFVFIGIVPFVLFWRVPIRLWQRSSSALWALNIGLLAVVMVKGDTAKGAQRWIDLGPFQFQPSELSKILCVITLATFFANRKDSVNKLSTLLLSFLHVLPSLLLIYKQPHLGATVVVFLSWLSICVVAGVPWRNLVLVGVVLGLLAGTMSLRDYQKDRIKGFVARGKEQQGANYQAHQAALAFGSGGLVGKGYLKGEQKVNIPERQNDFIFAVVGEEGGMVVCGLVFLAFCTLFGRIWMIMTQAEDPWGRYACAGILGALAFHTIVNLAMNLALVPVVGLWLPFMSSGGTALWLCFACMGMVHNVYRTEESRLFS